MGVRRFVHVGRREVCERVTDGKCVGEEKRERKKRDKSNVALQAECPDCSSKKLPKG